MKRWMEFMPILAAGISAAAAPAMQRFEAENVLVNTEAIVRDKEQKGRWNLWSKDVDAEKNGPAASCCREM